MDFSNRDVQPSSPASASGTRHTAAPAPKPGGKKHKRLQHAEIGRIVTVLLVAAMGILLGAVITYIIAGSGNVKDASKYVDTSRLQVVALNNGQAYFGHIQSLNDKYLVMSDIYYLQASNSGTGSGASSGSSNSNTVTLVKLGCEIHQPYDQMIINTDQVTFWENLQPDGKVAQKVNEFQQQHPEGFKCADQGSTSSSSSTSNTQNASPSPSSNKQQ